MRLQFAVALVLLGACARSSTVASSTGASPTAREVDLTKPPVLGPPKGLTLPAVVTRDLPNGLRLMIVEQHELPLADFVLVVKSGAETDEPGKLGTATLATSLLIHLVILALVSALVQNKLHRQEFQPIALVDLPSSVSLSRIPSTPPPDDPGSRRWPDLNAQRRRSGCRAPLRPACCASCCR